MNTNLLRNIAIGFAIYYGWNLYNQSTAAKASKVYFDGLDIKPGQGFSTPDFIAKFRILNPANTAITAKNLVGEVLVNGKQFGIVSSVESIRVPGSSEALAKVKLRIPIASLLSSVVNLIRSKQKLAVVFNGSINSNGILMPIRQQIFVQP